MSDKELIKQEIERRINDLKGYVLQKGSDQRWVTAIDQLTWIKAFIDSFPEEPGCEVNFTTKSEDLEEEIERWIKEKHFIFTEIDEIIETARHFAEWQKKKDQETIELAEDHAMLAGMNRMKEEMMGNAVECTWGSQATSSFMSDFPNIECGDKVKIIICKTEQQ